MARQILVKCGSIWFEFTKSSTGQLDFTGEIDGVSELELSGFQKIAGSAYFSPSHYIFVSDYLNMVPTIFVAPDVDVSSTDVFGYLVHVGALLSAVYAKDSLLAGELYLRRHETFDKFAQLTQYIMKDICVEILFSLCYCRMQNINPDDIPLVFNNAQKKMDFDPSEESLDQCFIRYFKSHECTLTLPLVGTQFYNWNVAPKILENLCNNLSVENLVSHAEKLRKVKHDFYDSLKIVAQAEPYNPHDTNAILVSMEGIESKIFGNIGFEKVGHIRALAAKILRIAKKQKMAYKIELARISSCEIVVSLEV